MIAKKSNKKMTSVSIGLLNVYLRKRYRKSYMNLWIYFYGELKC
ncbi:hypothetical protein LEP1GSC008_1333 [Leptospira kirschneri serovar Bulgarica str. Nikolaevo]|uniref:Uncharacterized protein n=1 Tax=Leptospira kirschneri serovar Bulgarica str. Nikolaevo TaxID=1240687 RepID=M6FNS2_9LEPT|nr:hypothetical protein LEP1GSC008_1333 [Leptospira kirschneri serovar Bulgarica str. Nikolaevo]